MNVYLKSERIYVLFVLAQDTPKISRMFPVSCQLNFDGTFIVGSTARNDHFEKNNTNWILKEDILLYDPEFITTSVQNILYNKN